VVKVQVSNLASFSFRLVRQYRVESPQEFCYLSILICVFVCSLITRYGLANTAGAMGLTNVYIYAQGWSGGLWAAPCNPMVG